jgi:hypothetical protein
LVDRSAHVRHLSLAKIHCWVAAQASNDQALANAVNSSDCQSPDERMILYGERRKQRMDRFLKIARSMITRGSLPAYIADEIVSGRLSIYVLAVFSPREFAHVTGYW